MSNQPFHVSPAPFIDAKGVKRASYQALDSRGQAIGVVSIADGKVVHSLATDACNLGALVNQAITHFNVTEAIRFGGNPLWPLT